MQLYSKTSLFDDDDIADLTASDSDVRLAGDSGPLLEADDSSPSGQSVLDFDDDSDQAISDSDSDVKLVESGTDPDINLADVAPGGFASGTSTEADIELAGSFSDDSDIVLTDSDSDIRIESDDEPDSDSDVNLVGGDESGDDSDSDVKLSLPDDSDLTLIDELQDDDDTDSGITMNTSDEEDSGISLEIDDSGISLEADDSGISLEADDSGIILDSEDSGIILSADDDSGISLDAKTGHMAVEGATVAGDIDAETRQMDLLGADESSGDGGTEGFATGEFDMGLLDEEDDDTGTDTSILMFEDDGMSSDTDMDPASVESEFDDDSFGDDFDDDEMDDVFEVDDEDDFESGQSQVGFAAPGAATGRTTEASWGTGVNVGVFAGSMFSVLGAFAGFELVRTMWMWFKPGGAESSFLEMIGGLFV